MLRRLLLSDRAKAYCNAAAASQPGPTCAIAIGNFDGVHLGHQALIHAAQQAAVQSSMLTAVMLFEPQPAEYFCALNTVNTTTPPRRITPLRDKLKALALYGVDIVFVARFSQKFAALSPDAFVQQLVHERCHARAVRVGQDFRFGHKRMGDVAMLTQLCGHLQIQAQAIDEVRDNAQRISSSQIRAALQGGDIARANQLTGRVLSLSGKVLHGQKLARQLEMPTLNLAPKTAHPAVRGIFVVQVSAVFLDKPRYGVASMGLRPTVMQTQRWALEVHLFDWSGDAYGAEVCVSFLHFLRHETAFTGDDFLAQLKTAMHNDAADARTWLTQKNYV